MRETRSNLSHSRLVIAYTHPIFPTYLPFPQAPSFHVSMQPIEEHPIYTRVALEIYYAEWIAESCLPDYQRTASILEGCLTAQLQNGV